MKQKTTKSLAFYLSFTILSFVTFVFVGLLLFNYSVSRSLLLKNVEENTRNLTSSAINKSEGFFRAIEKIAHNTAIFIRKNPHLQSNTEELLCEIVAGNSEIYGSCMAWKPIEKNNKIFYNAPYCWKEDNTVFSTDLADDDYFYPNWDWYKKPAQSHQAVWSEPYFDEGGGNILMTTFSVPVYIEENDTSSFVGILTVDVSLQWLHDVVSEIQIFQSGYAFLLSKTGVVLSHPDTSLIMQTNLFLLAKTDKHHNLKKITEKMEEGLKGFEVVDEGFFSEKSWVYFSSLENNKWTLAFVFPERELYADIKKLNIKLLFIFSMGIVLLFVFIIWLSSRLTLPIRKLSQFLDEGSEHFINKSIPESKGSTEVILLQQSFLALQKQLSKHIQSIEEITSEKQRVDSEISIAGSLQMSMLPNIESMSYGENISINSFIRPAKSIGGDFYEVNLIDKNHIFIAIGDVSGKGMGAAIFMAMTITLLRAYSKLCGNDIKRIFKLTEEYLINNNQKKYFVTVFGGILNLDSGVFEWVNAGHNFPYVVQSKAKNIKSLNVTHLPPIGILPMKEFSSGKTHLENNDIIFMFTDGVTEAMNEKGDVFSTPRLHSLLSQELCSPNENYLNHILNQVEEFSQNAEQHDDITMLMLKWSSIDNNKFRFKLQCKSEDIEKLRINVESAFAEKVINGLNMNRLVLVLEEVITNTVKYGKQQKENSCIDIEIRLTNDFFVVNISDNSSAFDPVDQIRKAQKEPPLLETIGNRGLLLVNSIVEEISYKRIANKNILKFKIKLK